MSKTQSQKIARSGRPVIAIPEDLAEILRDFAKDADLNMSDIARAALRGTLPKLKSGEASIVNGRYIERPKAAQAA